jgi:single-strand DNA-binding protein
MNKMILKGRLTAEPDLKTTQSGVEYCSFTVAVDRRVGKDSEKVTDFIPCKAWRQTAAFVNTYFGKGKEILLDGSMQVDKYEKDGENRTYTYVNVSNVEFCGGKSDNGQAKPDLQDVKNKLDAIVPDTSDEDLPF